LIALVAQKGKAIVSRIAMVMTNEPSTVLTLGLAAEYLKISKAHLSNVINGKVEGVPK
jgi:hypothetical protein